MSQQVAAVSRMPAVVMGRGDRRTTKGKRKVKSFGVSRPRNAELRKRAGINPGINLGVAVPAVEIDDVSTMKRAALAW